MLSSYFPPRLFSEQEPDLFEKDINAHGLGNGWAHLTPYTIPSRGALGSRFNGVAEADGPLASQLALQ